VKSGARRESFWPSTTQERILQTIFCEPERATAAWRDVREGLDLDVMEDGSYFLMPLLYRRLAELDIDDPDLPRLKGIYKRTWYRNQLLTEAVQRPLRDLHAAGIPAILLGAASASRWYSEVGTRWLEYFEAIVPAAEVGRVEATLEQCGFAPAAASRAHALQPAPFLDPAGNVFVVCGAPPLDLLPPGRLAAGAAVIRERTVATEFGGAPALALDPTDELMLVCVTGAKPGSRPVWVADAISLIRSAGSSIDWQRLCAQAVGSGLGLRLESSLLYLQSAFEASVPEQVLSRLGGRSPSRRESLSHRLTARPAGLLGGFPSTLGEYVRLSSDVSATKAVAGYPRFLQQSWGLDHLGQVPWVATVKACQALRRVLPGGRARQRQLSALSRGSYPTSSRAPSTSQNRHVFAETP
jgi:hypothetical protein